MIFNFFAVKQTKTVDIFYSLITIICVTERTQRLV